MAFPGRLLQTFADIGFQLAVFRGFRQVGLDNQWAVYPPSTTKVVPVIHLDVGDSR